MSITYSTTVKDTRLTDVVTAIDAGGAGTLRIYTTGGSSSGTLLAEITFDSTCGTVSGGVLTFSGTPLTDSSAANSGTAAVAELWSGGGTQIVSGLTVGTSATDLVLSSTTIVAGQPVTLTSASITHG
jgi:hypothetical protein